MNKTVVGIVLLVVGVVLLLWGYQTASSVGSQLKQAFDGAPTNRALLLYAAGGVLCVLGIVRLAKK